jgi:hypothetical protein
VTSDPRQPSPAETVRDLLVAAWTKPEMPTGFVKTTMKLIADIPDDEKVEVLTHLARTTTWRPNAAEIRRAVVEQRGIFPSLAEAGRQGRRYARKRADIATGGPQPLYPFVHPAVADAVAVAGFDLTTPDGGPSFAKAYREAIDRRIGEIVAGPLNQPVEFHPVPVGTDRPPPDGIRWAAGGWRTPTGELIRADSGSQAALSPGEPVPAALTP